MRALIAIVMVGACHRDAPVEVRRDPVPPAPSPHPSPAPPPAPAPKHRVKGDIAASFSLESTDVVVAEPIVVRFELTPLKSDLTMAFGGDMRNSANYPLRFAVRAVDASGAVVCDLVNKPALMSFGGPGGDRVIAKGEKLTERFVLNPACPALATPGTYRVTLHRRVTSMAMVIKKPTPTSCDMVPIHEDPLPAGLDPACVKLLTDAPSVTSELSITVRPFDQAAVRKAIDERTRDKDEILRHRLTMHVCNFVTCTCPKTPSIADVMASVGATPQSGYPSACPP